MKGTLLRSGRRTPVRPRVRRPRHRCRGCPFLAPSGKCLDPCIRSGRCGDWVWYLRGGRQFRRLYVKPKDPRTFAQRYWRRRFGTASKKYSHAVSEHQQEAWIAQGEKLRSRPRLGQSGPLTGQQYAIRRDYLKNTPPQRESAQKHKKPLRIKGVFASTSEARRVLPGAAPGLHRRGIGRAAAHSVRGSAGNRGEPAWTPPTRRLRPWRLRRRLLRGRAPRWPVAHQGLGTAPGLPRSRSVLSARGSIWNSYPSIPLG